MTRGYRDLLIWLLVPFLAVACSGEGESVTPATTTTREEAAGDVPQPAARLAERLACENARPGEAGGEVEGEPAPKELVDCNIGDRQMSIRTYADPGDIERVLAANDPFCGFRTVGDRWIVMVNTQDSAELARQRLGGRVVTLAGCA